MNKIVPTAEEAVRDITSGSTIMLGGFAAAGLPLNLIEALIAQGASDLTVIGNSMTELFELVEARRVRKTVTTHTRLPSSFAINPIEEQYAEGTIDIELVPQGTLPERIRAAGVGVGGFYSPVGVGTFVAEGKTVRELDGKNYILEEPLRADFAFVRAYKADKFGNLIYRKSARNISPIVAMAAGTTIAEVEHVVDVGELGPEEIVTPGIFVDRVVEVPKRMRSVWLRY